MNPEPHKLYQQFHDMLVNASETNFDTDSQKLVMLAGVKEFPMRVKSATLPWHTINHSLEGAEQPATTE